MTWTRAIKPVYHLGSGIARHRKDEGQSGGIGFLRLLEPYHSVGENAAVYWAAINMNRPMVDPCLSLDMALPKHA